MELKTKCQNDQYQSDQRQNDQRQKDQRQNDQRQSDQRQSEQRQNDQLSVRRLQKEKEFSLGLAPKLDFNVGCMLRNFTKQLEIHSLNSQYVFLPLYIYFD